MVSNQSHEKECLSELTSMRNIGKEMSKKLLSIGITSPDMLRQIGAKEAFLRMKELYPDICLVFLYTLQGAIEDVDYNCLSEQTKEELKDFNNTFK